MNNFYDRIKDLDEEKFAEVKNEEPFIPLFSPNAKEETSGKTNEEKELNAQKEIRKIFEEAYKEGEKAGYEVGMRRVENLIKRLNNALSEIDKFREELKKKSERLCFELSILFAEAIIRREIKHDKEIIKEMIKKALEVCDEKSEITIRVRKEDAKYLMQDEASLKIVPDETLREEGFIIETDFGNIEGTISVQIEELKKRIMNDKD